MNPYLQLAGFLHVLATYFANPCSSGCRESKHCGIQHKMSSRERDQLFEKIIINAVRTTYNRMTSQGF